MIRLPARLEFTLTEAKILEDTIVDEKTGDRVIKAEVKWQHAGIINNNKRRYRKELLEREIEKLRPLVKDKRIHGSSFHPKEGMGDSHDATHLWEDIWMTDKGECLGVLKVLPTSKGKDIQAIIRYGGKIGISSRGAGTTTVKEELVEGKKIMFSDVNDDFSLKVPGDFVLGPSVPGAGIRQLLESQLDEAEDLIENKENDSMPKEIKTKDELKAAYPELIKELEESTKVTLAEEVKKAVDAAKVDWQKELIKAVDEKIAPLAQEKEKILEAIRAVVTMLTDVEGVVPLELVQIEPEPKVEKVEPKGDPKPPVIEKADEEKAKLQEEVNKLKIQLAEKEKVVADKEKVEAEIKLQSSLIKALDEKLATDEYKKYASLVRKELVDESGKVLIESVEKVDEKLKETKEKVANTLAEQEKLKIVKSGLDEKGIIQNPDNTPQLTEQQEGAKFREAKLASFKGTFAEWKQKFSKK